MSSRWVSLIALLACLIVLRVSGASDERNIAPYSSIRAVPYIGASLGYLVDGKASVGDDNTYMLTVPMTIRSPHTHLLQVYVTFPEKMSVSRIRLMQHKAAGGRRSAKSYDIELDTDGDSHYDTLVVRESSGLVEQWSEYMVDAPVSAYGLRLRVTGLSRESGPNYGGGLFSEIEVYSKQHAILEEKKAEQILQTAPFITVRNKSPLKSFLKEVSAPDVDEFSRGIFGSMWMFWKAGSSYQSTRSLRMIKKLSEIGVNRYWLYPGVYVDDADRSKLIRRPEKVENRYYVDRKLSKEKKTKIVPFRSSVVAGYSGNILGVLVGDMNRQGIDVVANELPIPYGLTGWDYPRVSKPKTYPCILSSKFAWDSSTRLYKEFMEAGVNGLVLGGDEFFFYGHDGLHEDEAPICKDQEGRSTGLCEPTCPQLYSARYGIERGGGPAADPVQVAAKWQLFEYERLAELFANYVDMMHASARDPIVTSLFHPDEARKINYGIAYDVMGHQGGVEEMSSNPYWTHNSYLGRSYFANETKRLRGASRTGKAHVTLQATPRFTNAGYENPVMVYGPAFLALMNGASGVSFYKHDYLFSGGRNDASPWVSKFFDLTLYLERLGLLNYRTPRSVALLYSRASDDIWYFSNQKQGAKASNGYLQQDAIMEVLFRNGVPFDLYYLDQPESLANLREYKAVVLPFPYAIGKRSLEEIERAHASGSAIIAMTHLGQVSEHGEPYGDAPVLQDVVGERFIDLDINSENYLSLSDKVMAALSGSLSGPGTLTFVSKGYDVECTVMEKDSKDYLLFCINWQNDPAEIELGIELPEGIYNASAINMDSVGTVYVNGDPDIPSSALSRFTARMDPGETRILHITYRPHKTATQ